MKVIKRALKIRLPQGQSAFLWGARKTGKTTYLKKNFSDSIYFDFLKSDLFLEITKNPALLRQRLLAADKQKLKRPVILDEVQKVPSVLDEVHWLIENKGISFILCGSSARKIRQTHANLLGGRAWRFEMFPLVFSELKDINLLRALNQGLIPSHYTQNYSDSQRSLEAYVQDYLKEEIYAEGFTRNFPAFSRFLDAFAYSHGELVNYSNIARDCGIDSKTVREYFQILIDTLIAVRIEPFKKKQSRDVITQACKYYLFDVGVAGYLTKRSIAAEKGREFGRAFEHYILTELIAYRSYSKKNFDINFWRTKYGLEVDFILDGGKVAIEVKGGAVNKKDLGGIFAFSKDFSDSRIIVVCNEKEKRVIDKAQVMPWRTFLNDLWDGKVV